MCHVHGGIFGFYPQVRFCSRHNDSQTFVLPNEYLKFVTAFSLEEEQGANATWICKPADLSRGRKIFLFRSLDQLTYDCQAVVQRYVDRPMLVSGYKFDLRLYVLVTSFSPLRIYFHRSGLVRFGTEKYQDADIHNLYAHLTNASINKLGPQFRKDKVGIGAGCKWPLWKLLGSLEASGLDTKRIMWRMKDIAVLTLLAIADQVPQVNNCFELYGFDMMLDEQAKPWLLEVNMSPALSTDEGQVDLEVKQPMVSDLVDVLAAVEQERRAKAIDRVTLKALGRRGVSKPSYICEDEQKVLIGGWEMVFPFSRTSEELVDLCATGVKLDVKACVSELRERWRKGAAMLMPGLGIRGPLAQVTIHRKGKEREDPVVDSGCLATGKRTESIDRSARWSSPSTLSRLTLEPRTMTAPHRYGKRAWI